MKLRNKKTGEVVEAYKEGPIDLYFYLNKYEGENKVDRKTYKSLSELNYDWEDYVPKEPLIKDEKIRKAVRAWAEANDVLEVFIDRIGDGTYIELYDEDDGRRRISALRPAGLKTGEAYTIDELCGEEEE